MQSKTETLALIEKLADFFIHTCLRCVLFSFLACEPHYNPYCAMQVVQPLNFSTKLIYHSS